MWIIYRIGINYQFQLEDLFIFKRMFGCLMYIIICEFKYIVRENNIYGKVERWKLYFVFIIYLEEGKFRKIWNQKVWVLYGKYRLIIGEEI